MLMDKALRGLAVGQGKVHHGSKVRRAPKKRGDQHVRVQCA